MIKKHLRSLSATAFQIIFNQFSGLLFFVLLAIYLSQGLFGDLNWAVAVSYTITTMFTFGFDHVLVRRIAAGSDARITTGTYLSHTIIISLFLFIFLILHRILFPGFHSAHGLLFMVLCGGLFSFMSFPFRQFANGLQKFWHLAFMNVFGNVLRVLGMLLLIVLGKVTAPNLGWLFLTSGFMELLIAILLARHITGNLIRPVFRKKVYVLLFNEALPQLGVVLLESSLARLDWILMGLISTSIFTADYSFAYKAFDSSRIPLLIVAPVLLPKMARLYGSGKALDRHSIDELDKLWRLESVIAVVIPLILSTCWVDAINLVTNDKYGETTQFVYIILAIALPMLYVSNFFWTIAFSQKRIKDTFRISAAVTVTNLVLNLLLIPYFNAIGAAIACTCSLLVQMVLYRVIVKEPRLHTPMSDFIKTTLIGAVIALSIHYIDVHWLFKIPLALSAYIIVIYTTGMLNSVLPERLLFSRAQQRRNNDH